MKLFSRLLATGFLICLMVVPTLGGKAQSGIQQFAYLTYDTPETATVWLIDPSSLDTTPLTTISANSGEVIGAAFLNPTSEWIVVQFFLGQTASLRLIDLSTGVVVNVIDGMAFPPRPLHISSDFDVFEWSPNGRYFAFHTQVGNEGQNLFVYNMQLRELSNIGTAVENQYQLSWSPSGDQLAFVSLGCNVSGCTNASLNIYRMTTMALEHAIDLAAYTGNDGTESVNFCEIRWSADAAAISFFDYCDSSALGTPREIQVVDVASETITQATSLTPTDVPPTNSLFNATLDTIWASNTSLLMGTRLLTGEAYPPSGTVTSYTVRYDRQTRIVSTIDPRRLGRWARANNQLLAYAVYIYSLDSDNSPVLTESSVEVSSFDGQILSPVTSGPAGCLLSWNGSADTLAYVARDVTPVGLCEPNFEALHFLTDGELRTFEPTQEAYALGWFTQNQDSATPTETPTSTSTFTPEPTPTPTPTPSPTPTPAAFQRLRVSAICSDDPATSRRWRIRNPNPYPVPFTWEMLNSPSGQQGTGTAPVAVNGVPSAVVLTTATERWIPIIEVAANNRSDFAINLGIPCDWPSWLEP